MSIAASERPAVERHDGAEPAAYPRLFSPITLGRLTLRNRIMMPAMTTNFAEPDGSVGDRLVGYLRARALGGYGAIVTENMGVHPTGRVMPRMVMADDDRYANGLRRLARTVKAAGSVLIGQLSHAGRQTRSKITGHPLVAPSPIPCPLNRELPRELRADEIAVMERAFVNAAVRLADAEFDGVEIHGAHGYLVGAFLSGYSNRRTDAYGGSLPNRMRFLLGIVSGIQRQLGRGFPLIVRISADEFVEGGVHVEQAIAIAAALRDAGVHALSVSVGVYESFNKLSMITGEPEGQWLSLAGQVKAGAGLPVIGVGRIKRPRVAEDALAAGLIDIAAFGRAAIADPELPAKVITGRERDVVWCLGCNVCLGRSSRPETICPVNPEVGREHALHVARCAEPRVVRIAGTALSALTAAWVAARRGHLVEVVEDRDDGGMQGWRARVPGQGEYRETIEAARRRAAAVGARFVSAGAARPADATWRVRRYEPIDRARLAGLRQAVSSYDVLSGRTPVAPRARVAVLGADLSAAEAALCAAVSGAAVTLFSSGRGVALDATVRTGPEGEPCPSDLAGRDLVVIGHVSGARYDDPAAWAGDGAPADAFLEDAYEPGNMTSGVYAAFELARTWDAR